MLEFYDDALAIAGMAVLLWFVRVLEVAYNAPLTWRQVLLVAGAAAFFVLLLWFVVKPRSGSMKVKVVLYGALAGMVIGIGILGWLNLWLPEIPLGG